MKKYNMHQVNNTKFKETEIGWILEEWEVFSIKEVAFVIGGGTPSTNDKKNFGGDVPWITPDDLSSWKQRNISKGRRNITLQGLKSIGNKLLPINTILLSTRAPIGYLAIAENELVTNQGFKNLIIKKNFFYKFVFYLLKFNTDFLKNNASGSTFLELSGNALEKLKFAFPPLQEQIQIAEILSSLDDKIELNRRMNETLEKIGQTLFKHWFVDFEFPDENGRPYKSSGGKMIDSELGEIPEEWEKGKIKNILKIISGFAFSTKNYNREGKWGIVTIKNVQEGNFISECTDFILDLPIKMSADIILNKGDIVLSLTGNIGRVCVVYGGKYLLNQRVAKIVSINKQNIAFCYFLLRQKNFQDLLISISKGVAQQNLSPVEMANLNIIIPGDNILKKFSLISSNIIEQIMKNLEENQILSQIRDSLLPRLMSGKLRVK